MTTMSDSPILSVALHGDPVGTLTRLPGDRTIFAFDQSYVEQPNRPTLGLWFKDEHGELLTESRTYQTRLHPFFSNLLPEGPLRAYLASRAGIKPTREFQLISELGRDLPGALTITPGESGRSADESADSIESENPRLSEAPLRFSLAGVQLKFSALRNDGRGGGLTVPATGAGGEWIIKLPSTAYEAVPENEYTMMSIARQIGIDVPDIELIPLDRIEGLPSGLGTLRGPAFVIRRFDRSAHGRIHMEDFAQVFGLYPDDKYDKASYRKIAAVLGIETDDTSISQFIRRLVFSTLIGNADMHLKNWTLIYPDRRRAVLSPAYDLLSTIPYIPDANASLKYARTKRMDELTYDELTYMAAKARLPTAPVLAAARETVEGFLETWHADKAHYGIPRMVVDAIDRHLQGLPLCR